MMFGTSHPHYQNHDRRPDATIISNPTKIREVFRSRFGEGGKVWSLLGIQYSRYKELEIGKGDADLDEEYSLLADDWCIASYDLVYRLACGFVYLSVKPLSDLDVLRYVDTPDR